MFVDAVSWMLPGYLTLYLIRKALERDLSGNSAFLGFIFFSLSWLLCFAALICLLQYRRGYSLRGFVFLLFLGNAMEVPQPRTLWGWVFLMSEAPLYRCRAKMAHARQSRPDSGPGF